MHSSKNKSLSEPIKTINKQPMKQLTYQGLFIVKLRENMGIVSNFQPNNSTRNSIKSGFSWALNTNNKTQQAKAINQLKFQPTDFFYRVPIVQLGVGLVFTLFSIELPPKRSQREALELGTNWYAKHSGSKNFFFVDRKIAIINMYFLLEYGHFGAVKALAK